MTSLRWSEVGQHWKLSIQVKPTSESIATASRRQDSFLEFHPQTPCETTQDHITDTVIEANHTTQDNVNQHNNTNAVPNGYRLTSPHVATPSELCARQPPSRLARHPHRQLFHYMALSACVTSVAALRCRRRPRCPSARMHMGRIASAGDHPRTLQPLLSPAKAEEAA